MKTITISNLKTYQNIAILGFGKEGKATLSFLEKIGINKNDIKILDQTISNNYLDNLGKFDLIFKTPGISPYHPKLIKYRDKFLSGAQLFFDNYHGKVIGVTATKGKSTTSTLIYKTLKLAGYNVKLVGNIGNPILDEVDLLSHEKYDYIVYELSSYMLETLKPKCFIGVFGNIYPCHIDWHNNDYDIYKNAKLNLLKYSQNILIGYDFRNLFEISKNENFYTFGNEGNYNFKNKNFYINSYKIFSDEGIMLKGDHNKKNICAVLGVCDIIKKDKYNSNWVFAKLLNGLKSTLKTFSGLSHRLENIGTYNGITFIDDGISTTPESTIEAIKTFQGDIGTLLLGGQDSGFSDKSLESLANKIINSKIKNIVLFPDTGSRILPNINNHNLNILQTTSMKEAIEFSFKNSTKGKICLMSNAAPSFSLWKSYIEKGKEFRKEIKNYQ